MLKIITSLPPKKSRETATLDRFARPVEIDKKKNGMFFEDQMLCINTTRSPYFKLSLLEVLISHFQFQV